MSRERHQAESDAAAERRALIRNCNIVAFTFFAIAAVMLGVVILGHWTRDHLPSKGKMLLWTAIAAGSGYAAFRYARRLKADA